MKHTIIGILAHVDAGKTTLSEGMLYQSGALKKLGRVDHKDAFLDTFSLERERGITIFSKQARFSWKDLEITLLHTQGHVDFSTEMERTLQVLDYAILVINGSNGVQGHTETLWKLLRLYHIPTFVFVNKMDLQVKEKAELMLEMQEKLSDNCIDFSVSAEKNKEDFFENIAMCDEKTLDLFMETGRIDEKKISDLIQERKVFPCYFGAALKMDGIQALLDGIATYVKQKKYPEKFAAKVYKIARDEQKNRLTYLKVTGGTLQTKDIVTGKTTGIVEGQAEEWQEKVNQLRIYSGEKYETVQSVQAGVICAVTGLSKTYPGQNLGGENTEELSVLEPVLTYQILFEEDVDPAGAFREIKVLVEEDPQLHIIWNETLQEVHIQLMGEVQIEVLKQLIYERFGYRVSFGQGTIVYKETIKEEVEGVGHFEPLRHYAEVHLRLEPLEVGSGLQFAIDCSEDILDKNWQRLIYTHLEEKEHIGVLTGSPITDMRITLVSGKAHNKHTEGGDFRQATYRAVRQGLRMAENILLEPYYQFTLQVPVNQIGRAMNDVKRMYGEMDVPVTKEDFSILKGKAPVATMQGYVKEVHAYTHGKGQLNCQVCGYFPCHNTEEVIEKIGYDSEADLDNPTCSVFCAHGSGFLVPWNQVRQYMHVESYYKKDVEIVTEQKVLKREAMDSIGDEAELERIMLREFGEERKRFDDYGNVYYNEEDRKIKKIVTEEKKTGDPKYQKRIAKSKNREEYLLVDGYNIIFAWEELNELSKISLDAARGKLMDILCDYQGYSKQNVIVVFDAYKVKGNPGSVHKYHNISVVFTKEAETADMYIEKVTHKIGKDYKVIVATSDGMEQVIIMQQGALRMSARDFKKHIEWTKKQMGDYVIQN